MRKRTRHFLKNVQLVDMATAFNFRRLRVELNVCHAEIRALMIWKCLLHHPSALTRRAALIDYGIRYDKRFLSVIDQKLDFEVALKAERQK